MDTLAYRYFRDPLVFWRIADANEAMLPRELTEELGRRLSIPLAEG